MDSPWLVLALAPCVGWASWEAELAVLATVGPCSLGSEVGEVVWQDTRAARSSGCRVNRRDEDAMERWLVVRVGGEAERGDVARFGGGPIPTSHYPYKITRAGHPAGETDPNGAALHSEQLRTSTFSTGVRTGSNWPQVPCGAIERAGSLPLGTGGVNGGPLRGAVPKAIRPSHKEGLGALQGGPTTGHSWSNPGRGAQVGDLQTLYIWVPSTAVGGPGAHSPCCRTPMASWMSCQQSRLKLGLRRRKAGW